MAEELIIENDAPVAVLAGGLGTRLGTLTSATPKPMIPVAGKPFLYWLLRRFSESGFRHFVLLVSYLAEQIEEYPWEQEIPGVKVQFHRDRRPEGSGGAVFRLVESGKVRLPFLLINGDTIVASGVKPFRAKGEAHYFVLDPAEIFDAAPNLAVSESAIVAGNAGRKVFDSGMIAISEAAIRRYHGGFPCSLNEMLRPAVEAGEVGYTMLEGTCYDIGTPERLKRFTNFLAKERSVDGYHTNPV